MRRLRGELVLRGEKVFLGVKVFLGEDVLLGAFEGKACPALERGVAAGKAWPALVGDIGAKLPAGLSLCMYSAAVFAASRPRACNQHIYIGALCAVEQHNVADNP